MDSSGWSQQVLAQVQGGNFTLEAIALFITLVICAFASAAETALTSVNHIRISNLAEEGNPRAIQIEKLLAQPSRFLTTILIVNNVAIVLASALATGIALIFSPQWGEAIATLVISFTTLVFCEVTPKNAAVRNSERWSLGFAHIVSGMSWVLRPLTSGLNALTNLLMRIIGIPQQPRGPSVTEQELLMLVGVGEKEGILEKGERSMINSVLELSETTVREVMIPRIDMITLKASTSIEDAIELITQGGQSRIPIYEETIDNIIGVLYAKDLLREMRHHPSNFPIRSLIRTAYFVPESKKLDDLLHELQNRRVHMAIVIDEYGAVAGLVTIEDLVEEIVGDIQDEYDVEEKLFEQISDNEFQVDGKVHIEDLGELLGRKWESGNDYDSVAGLFLSRLDKIPSVGDEITIGDVQLTVLATRGRRITRVRAIIEESDSPSNNNHNHDVRSDSERDREAPIEMNRTWQSLPLSPW
jgi:putative hemolysin